MIQNITIGTRGSALAIAQTDWVIGKLRQFYPDLHIEKVIIKTQGDRNTETPLAQIGGKGLFVKEIEKALVEGQIDLAVHSLKDLPTEIPEGLTVAAIPERADPSDALIFSDKNTIPGKEISIQDLPKYARIGSSSLRRKAQLENFRSDLKVQPLRGNLDTRLRKLGEEKWDAIVLAAAGLIRLGLEDRITLRIPTDICLPAVGQGALAFETRLEDSSTVQKIQALDHKPSRTQVTAERAFLKTLGGGCQVPIGALAQIEKNSILLQGVLADPDGVRVMRDSIRGPLEEAASLGKALAERLLENGGAEIMRDFNANK